ncbi:hypothetical protein GQ607_002078 [Colletotrichum asianum]|uniref:Uncharacterized protein n=1 Tax=Colletotrichum asianum TaxID=702518 RepID=A0A8H3WNL7_9PEZI|nr:hypothetical protein GQ607_002078 [Colletotrichum asianum]
MTGWPSIPCRISACTTQAFLRQLHSLLSQGRWAMVHQTRHGSPFPVHEKANTPCWWHPIHQLTTLPICPAFRSLALPSLPASITASTEVQNTLPPVPNTSAVQPPTPEPHGHRPLSVAQWTRPRAGRPAFLSQRAPLINKPTPAKGPCHVRLAFVRRCRLSSSPLLAGAREQVPIKNASDGPLPHVGEFPANETDEWKQSQPNCYVRKPASGEQRRALWMSPGRSSSALCTYRTGVTSRSRTGAHPNFAGKNCNATP